jgi:hypothetical protein
MLSRAPYSAIKLKPNTDTDTSSNATPKFQTLVTQLDALLDKGFKNINLDLAKIATKKQNDRQGSFKKPADFHNDFFKKLNKLLYVDFTETLNQENISIYLNILKKIDFQTEEYLVKIHHLVYEDRNIPKSFGCISEILEFKLSYVQRLLAHSNTEEESEILKNNIKKWIDCLADKQSKTSYYAVYHLALSQSYQEMGAIQSENQHYLEAAHYLEKLTNFPVSGHEIIYFYEKAIECINKNDFSTASSLIDLNCELIYHFTLNPKSDHKGLIEKLCTIQNASKIKIAQVLQDHLIQEQTARLSYLSYLDGYRLLSSLNRKIDKTISDTLLLLKKTYWDEIKLLCSGYPVTLLANRDTLHIPLPKDIDYKLEVAFETFLNNQEISTNKVLEAKTYVILNVTNYSLDQIKSTLDYLNQVHQLHQKNLDEQNKTKAKEKMIKLEQKMAALKLHLERLESQSSISNNSNNINNLSESSGYFSSYTPNEERYILPTPKIKIKTKGTPKIQDPNNPQEEKELSQAEKLGFDDEAFRHLEIYHVRTRGDLPKAIYVALDDIDAQDDCDKEVRQQYKDHVFAHAKLCSAKGESGFKFNKGNDKVLIAKHKSWQYRGTPTTVATNDNGDSLYVYNSLIDTKSGKKKNCKL